MKNKILYITPSVEIGGTEKIIISLATQIKSLNFQPVILTLQHRGLFHKTLDSHLITNYALNLKKNPLYGLIKCLFVFFKEKPCMMHSFLFTGNIFARCVRFFIWIPLVCSQRSTDNWRKKIHWILEKYTCFLCNVIVSNSTAGKNVLMEKAGIPGKKILVIFNGIDIREIKQKIKTDNPMHNGIIAGSVGNLRKAKGYDNLIESADIIHKHKKRNDIKFIIIGKGPLWNFLQQKIKQLQLSHIVSMCGFMDDIYEYISQFDIVIIPSLWEGFPVIALEATACGKPIIATSVGDLPKIVQDGINGLLVEPGNPRALAEAIIKLADNIDMRQQMGRNSEEIAEKFSLETMVKNYARLYKHVISKDATNFR